MKQKFTILFDLDGTLVGKGAGAMIGRSIWGQAKKEFSKVNDEKIKKEMVSEFVDFYGKNIINESTLINGVKEFLIWSKENNIAQCTSKKFILIFNTI